MRVFDPDLVTKIIYSGSAICSLGLFLKKENGLNLEMFDSSSTERLT